MKFFLGVGIQLYGKQEERTLVGEVGIVCAWGQELSWWGAGVLGWQEEYCMLVCGASLGPLGLGPCWAGIQKITAMSRGDNPQ